MAGDPPSGEGDYARPGDILFTEITVPTGAPTGGDTLVAGERSG